MTPSIELHCYQDAICEKSIHISYDSGSENTHVTASILWQQGGFSIWHHGKRKLGWADFFAYDEEKDLKACFSLTRLTRKLGTKSEFLKGNDIKDSLSHTVFRCSCMLQLNDFSRSSQGLLIDLQDNAVQMSMVSEIDVVHQHLVTWWAYLKSLVTSPVNTCHTHDWCQHFTSEVWAPIQCLTLSKCTCTDRF